MVMVCINFVCICVTAAAEAEKSEYERHKAEKRVQAAQVLGQQRPARVGKGITFPSHDRGSCVLINQRMTLHEFRRPSAF